MQRFVSFFAWAAVAILSTGAVHAQSGFELRPGPDIEILPGHSTSRATCTEQVLAYGLTKGTGLQSISINNATSAQGAGQWFDAPAPIEITGTNFYAFVNDAGAPVSATVAVYASDAVDRLPLGAPLATTTILITNEIGGATLDELRQTVVFASPVVVDGPFVVAVENQSPNSIVLVSNSYTSADGAGEFLASADIAGTWIPGDQINIGGLPFDADWLIEPIVRFELVPEVTATPVCLTETTTVALSADSPYLQSRFFNLAAFLDLTQESYSWDFDDGSPTALGADQTHEYSFVPGVVYQPTVTATLFPFVGETSCIEVASTTVSTLASCELLFSDRFE